MVTRFDSPKAQAGLWGHWRFPIRRRADKSSSWSPNCHPQQFMGFSSVSKNQFQIECFMRSKFGSSRIRNSHFGSNLPNKLHREQTLKEDGVRPTDETSMERALIAVSSSVRKRFQISIQFLDENTAQNLWRPKSKREFDQKNSMITRDREQNNRRENVPTVLNQIQSLIS